MTELHSPRSHRQRRIGALIGAIALAATWCASAAPTTAASSGQMVLFDHQGAQTATSYWAPTASQPDDYTSPTNYADGRLYLKLDVIDKPSDTAMWPQLCFWRHSSTTKYKWETCSQQGAVTITTEGTHYLDLGPVSSWWKKNGNYDWTQPASVIRIMLKDPETNKLFLSTSCGNTCYVGDIDQHVPVVFRAAAIMVPHGATFTPPPGWNTATPPPSTTPPLAGSAPGYDATGRVATGSQTAIRGAANRSALVGIVSAASAGPGHLEVLQCGATPGSTSSVNTDGVGQVRAGTALTRFGADGTACVYNVGATHLVADIQGYFADHAIDDVDDRRLLDTRSTRRPAARSITRVAGGRPGSTGIVSLTAVNTSGVGHLSVLPCTSGTEPRTSNLNWTTSGTTLATMAFVEFDHTGAICVYNHDEADIIVDLQGYAVADAFDDVADQRLLDTRQGSRPSPATSTRIHGRPGSTAVVSLVAIAAAAPGFLQLHDCGLVPGRTSNLNVDRPGATIASLATVRFDETGTACLYTLAATDLVVDLQGYFVEGAFEDIVDARVLDTRR